MGRLILVTNDDGIDAQGMWHLAEALQAVGEVVIVAPARDASGSGAALAVRGPIACRSVDGPVQAYALDSTPAACVWAGARSLLHRRPDLVVSGVNVGPNLGRDVLLSGTVGAALMAGSLGMPALAVSTDLGAAPDWRAPVQAAVAAAAQLLSRPLPAPLVLNLNVPAGERVAGAEVTRLSTFTHLDMIQIDLRYHDDALQLVPVMEYHRPERTVPGTDLHAYANGLASITALEPGSGEAWVVAELERLAATLGAGRRAEAVGE